MYEVMNAASIQIRIAQTREADGQFQLTNEGVQGPSEPTGFAHSYQGQRNGDLEQAEGHNGAADRVYPAI